MARKAEYNDPAEIDIRSLSYRRNGDNDEYVIVKIIYRVRWTKDSGPVPRPVETEVFKKLSFVATVGDPEIAGITTDITDHILALVAQQEIEDEP